MQSPEPKGTQEASSTFYSFPLSSRLTVPTRALQGRQVGSPGPVPEGRRWQGAGRGVRLTLETPGEAGQTEGLRQVSLPGLGAEA